MTRKLYLFSMFLAVSFAVMGQNERAHRYMQLLDYQDAADEFESQMKNLSVNDLVDYADVLYHSRSYEKALLAYNKAIDEGADLNDISRRNYRHCKSIDKDEMQILSNEDAYFRYSPYAHIDVDPACMNSGNEDVSPFYWQGNLYVASSREDLANRREFKYAFTNLPFLKVVELSEECDSTTPHFDLPEDLNGKFHSGPITISDNGNHMVATRNYAEPNEENQVNLYLLHFIKSEGGWTKGKILPFCNPNYSVQHAMFDSTGSTIYFSSNMPSSYGGFDLYTSSWNGLEWSEPVHLGDSINSVYDEVFPFFSPAGLLGYSTNHIEGYGGLDLAVFYGGKRFLMAPPLNSVHDEYGLTFKTDSIGYFSSNRLDGSFNDDIFRVSPVLLIDMSIKEQTIEEPEEEIELIAATSESESPVVATMPVVAAPFSATGWTGLLYFDHDRPSRSENTTYRQLYDSYLTQKSTFSQKSQNSTDDIQVFFEEIEMSFSSLDSILQMGLESETSPEEMVFVLSSYCSPVGSQSYNISLAERRNRSVQQYIMQWNNGYYSDAQFESTSYGEPERSGGLDVDDVRTSVYGVEASKWRHTSVKIEVR